VRIPAELIEHPDQITVDRIDAEQNAEIRRVMMDLYGTARYLLDSGAASVNQDDYGILYRKEVPNDEPIVMVRVLNSTPEPDGVMSNEEAVEAFGMDAVQKRLATMEKLGVDGYQRARWKQYFIRVPPDIQTAHAAVAWTCGFDDPSKYRPQIES
jgi:hypothetical protein